MSKGSDRKFGQRFSGCFPVRQVDADRPDGGVLEAEGFEPRFRFGDGVDFGAELGEAEGELSADAGSGTSYLGSNVINLIARDHFGPFYLSELRSFAAFNPSLPLKTFAVKWYM